MKKNPKDLVWLSLEELKEHFGEDGLCLACRCVGMEEDIEHLYVLMMDKPGSSDYDPISISCEKCREALLASFPFVEKLADSGQIQPYPKAGVLLAIETYTQSFLKRGLNPEERITVTLIEVPAAFDAVLEAAQFEKELDEMKKWPIW